LNTRDIYFVYIGNRLPRYANSSLELANRFSGLRINLIGSSELKSKLNNTEVNFIDINEFYDSSQLIRISSNLNTSHTFRQGFWLKSLERFLVLEQFMKFASIDSLLHAELDQLLFGTDSLLTKLESIDVDGMYLPFHNSDAAVASIAYIKNSNTLTSLIEFAETKTFNNEMQLIADWAKLEPERVFALPTLASEIIDYENIENVQIIDPAKIGGVVDAAQIGQWVAGIDPRNVPIRNRPRNNFVDIVNPYTLDSHSLRNLKFVFVESENLLKVESANSFSIRLYNLHIHSKIHLNLIRNKPALSNLFGLINSQTSITFSGTRKIQITHYIKIRLGNFLEDPSRLKARLTMRVKFALRLRKSSEPFISGDTFRKMADLVWEKSSKNFDTADVKPHSIIFAESDCVFDLKDKILNNLSHPITLILGNSDQNHGEDFLFLKDNLNIKKIYAQNLASDMNGFIPLPIGLENAWRSSHGDVSAFKKLMRIESKRIPRVMWTFTIETNPKVRGAAATELKRVSVADKFGQKSSREHRKLLMSYSFIASPPGNGLDTHRCWEAMYLGCIPVVLKSHMNNFYEELGLPIWVIDSYSQLELINELELDQKYEEYRPRFENKALWFDYWQKEIRS
jgi:hypothetical protein